MTKKVWQYKRTGGQYIGEWEDDAIIQVPYTDVPPLEEIKLEDQFFLPSEKRWKEIVNQLDREALDNLSALYTALQNENDALKQKNDGLAGLNSKLMLNDIGFEKRIHALEAEKAGGE